MSKADQTNTTEHAGGARVATPELIEFRELVSQEAAACAVANAANEAHDKEGEAKAMASLQPLGKRIGELADVICARAARSWAGVIECAEVARWWQEKGPDDYSLTGLASPSHEDRVPAYLISAILALAEGNVPAGRA